MNIHLWRFGMSMSYLFCMMHDVNIGQTMCRFLFWDYLNYPEPSRSFGKDLNISNILFFIPPSYSLRCLVHLSGTRHLHVSIWFPSAHLLALLFDWPKYLFGSMIDLISYQWTLSTSVNLQISFFQFLNPKNQQKPIKTSNPGNLET